MDFKTHRRQIRSFRIVWYIMLFYIILNIGSSFLNRIVGTDIYNELDNLINSPRTMYVKVLERFDFSQNIGNVESGYLVQHLDKKGEKIYLEATPSQFKIGDNLKVKVQRLREKKFPFQDEKSFKADIKVYTLKEAEIASVEKDEGEER